MMFRFFGEARTTRLGLVVLLLASCAVLLCASTAAAQLPFFLSKWGQAGNGNGELTSAAGIAIDDSGRVYVADRYRVQRFGANGSFQTKWGSQGLAAGQFQNPIGVEVDELGQVYVVDSVRGMVQVFDSSGTYLRSFGTASNTPGDGTMYWATQAAVASDGSVYVTDQGTAAGLGSNVQAFDILGDFSHRFGTFGSGVDQLRHPWGVAIDSQDNVYVVDSLNHRIQKYDAAGNYLMGWGTPGSGPGQFLRPTGADFDGDDRLYVADLMNNRVQVFNTEGKYLFEIGGAGTGDGQFYFPIDVAAGEFGNVYVLDFGNSRIQRFAVAVEVNFALGGGGGGGTPTVNLNSSGLLLVTLYSTSTANGDDQDFDATEVDTSTLLLGNAAVEHAGGHVGDQNGDGLPDLRLHFRIPDIGLVCGDTSVTLSGSNYEGTLLVGETSISTKC